MLGCNNHKQDHTKHTGPKVRVTSMEPRVRTIPQRCVLIGFFFFCTCRKQRVLTKVPRVHNPSFGYYQPTDYSRISNILKIISSECSIAYQLFRVYTLIATALRPKRPSGVKGSTILSVMGLGQKNSVFTIRSININNSEEANTEWIDSQILLFQDSLPQRFP